MIYAKMRCSYTVRTLKHVFCLVSAEDYDDSSNLSIEKIMSNRAIVPDDAQGQGQGSRQGEGLVKIERPIRARFSRPRYIPNYRKQMEFDFDSLAA